MSKGGFIQRLTSKKRPIPARFPEMGLLFGEKVRIRSTKAQHPLRGCRRATSDVLRSAGMKSAPSNQYGDWPLRPSRERRPEGAADLAGPHLTFVRDKDAEASV